MPRPRVSVYQYQSSYKIGFLGAMAMVAAVILFMYATTFKTETQGVFITAVLMLTVGLLLSAITVGVKFEGFNFKTVGESILWTAISVVAIWIVNQAVPFTLGFSPLDERSFAILMGVAEEAFFRLWLTTYIYAVTNKAWLAVPISSAIWTTYHINRYSGNMGAFLIIFFAGLILGWVILESKRADGVIFAHALVNFLATI